jgi:hypothetical protein
MTASACPPTCAWCNLRRPEYTQTDPDDERRILRVCRYCDLTIARRHEDARKARGE